MRYIVGIDGSVPSDAALVWATSRARRDSGTLLLAHVVDGEAGPGGRASLADATNLGRRLLEATRVRLQGEAPTLEVQTELLVGSVPWELARVAGPQDVLVIGTHKTGFSSGRVLGSLSVQIAVATTSTVAVIPATDVRFRRGVVAGIDREETAARIAEVAAREAEARGDELTLLHAGHASEGGVGDDGALQTALTHLRVDHPGLTVVARRSTRAASAALLDVARTKALLVIGPGATGADRAPIGTVTHEVLLNTNAPVLVAGV